MYECLAPGSEELSVHTWKVIVFVYCAWWRSRILIVLTELSRSISEGLFGLCNDFGGDSADAHNARFLLWCQTASEVDDVDISVNSGILSSLVLLIQIANCLRRHSMNVMLPAIRVLHCEASDARRASVGAFSIEAPKELGAE